MDKISHIVGSSARVGSGDAMSAPPVRPGTPTFGRAVGESPRGVRDDMSTAQRVDAIRTGMAEDKKMRAESKVASEMAEKFFFRPEEAMKTAPSSSVKGKMKMEAIEEPAIEEPSIRATSAHQESLVSGEDASLKAPPSRFSPRGSLIDVRA